MRSILTVLCVFCVVGAIVPSAQAQFVDELTFEFSGAQSPAGDPPWGRATFTGNTDGSVTLVMQSLLNGSAEHFKVWLFNLSPSLTPSDLTITYNSGVQATDPVATTDLNQGVSGGEAGLFKADGDGHYDIAFEWGNNEFLGDNEAGDPFSSSTYIFTSSAGALTAADFMYQSIDGGGTGTFFSAAHVGGLFDPAGAPGNTDGSGWIASAEPIPAPGAFVLAALGLGLVGVVRKRFS